MHILGLLGITADHKCCLPLSCLLPVIKSFFPVRLQTFFNVCLKAEFHLNFLKVSLQKPILLEKCHGHGHFLVTQFFSMTAATLVGLIMHVAGYTKIRPKVKLLFR